MAKYTTLTALFADVANAIRRKTGGTASIVAEDFPTAIDGLDTSGIHPSGTKSITTNGTHDVTNYASANVNVPASGITPSGSKTITENGTHDVISYASAVVNVPTPAQNIVTLPITISSNLGGGTAVEPTILSGNDFVKNHYADENFFGLLVPVSASDITANANVVTTVYTGNRLLLKSSYSYYGLFIAANGPSTYANAKANQYKISTDGYNVTLRAKNTGNVILYVAATYTVPAGNYLLILGLAE